MKEEVTQQLEMLFEKLKDFFASKTIVGSEIKIGKMTLLPVIEIAFGMGSGSGGGKVAQGQEGTGGGMGIGVKAKPSAFIVIKDDQVELLPLQKSGTFEKLVEKIPEIMEKMPNIPKTKDEMKDKK